MRLNSHRLPRINLLSRGVNLGLPEVSSEQLDIVNMGLMQTMYFAALTSNHKGLSSYGQVVYSWLSLRLGCLREGQVKTYHFGRYSLL